MPGELREKIVLDDNSYAGRLYGPGNHNLKRIAAELGVELGARGNEISVVAQNPNDLRLCKRIVEELYTLVKRNYPLNASDVERAILILRNDERQSLAPIFLDTVFTSSRGKGFGPKGLAQKQYLDAIKANDIVFGIGPAGSGKSFLAMAAAVAALTRKEVKRIVLCRPAVEAGEKLGFLPGDLAEKVNPYLRPLYDALNELLDPEKVKGLIEDGIVEIAPLAFMRGRAQPLSSKVLTHEGWRQIGSLNAGDHVIGSDGKPTQVLGVFPQGKKEVFRVTMTDGSSTLCCAEHLWAVYTASDKRRKKPARVMQTKEMMGQIKCFHQNRFELPLLSSPVYFPEQEVPLDPYSLGLLLGDGCFIEKATPSFSTNDEELVSGLGSGLSSLGVVPTYKSAYDYTLSRASRRGGPRLNPLTEQLKKLGLRGTHSFTKFIPEVYLYNSGKVRLAVLQGLLDTDGGPVTQTNRTCRIQYTTTSPKLREDVSFLVRSLGGVAYFRVRRAEGRKPGLAHGRPVPHRHDAYIMDLRLPPGVEPFRLTRKAELYNKLGGGRPMRFIKNIEPAGETEAVCIQVAAPDSLYVTDDFILTHNTLSSSFIILDEAQNTTPEQMKMFLTRLGFDSKAVVTGDITQIDLPTAQRSGLLEAREILHDVEGLKFCYFTSVDVVRHPLVQSIVKAYDHADSLKPPRPTRNTAPRFERAPEVTEPPKSE